jgi:putative sigma-54 modulation protein
MYSSIDLAAARIERQVRKWKDKIRDHKPHGGPSSSVREMVIPADSVEPRPDASAPPAPAAKATPPVGALRVIKDETFTARSMKVEDAVMQLNLLGDDIIVFTDADKQTISVLYRRKDGNYGLIETGRDSARDMARSRAGS